MSIPVEAFLHPGPRYSSEDPEIRKLELAAWKEEEANLHFELRDQRDRARNALKKACKTKPPVRKLLTLKDPIVRHYYEVTSTSKKKAAKSSDRWPLRDRVRLCRALALRPDVYIVVLYRDRDGRWFISCNCAAGYPPADDRLGVAKWHCNPCYHCGAVLIHFTNTVKALGAKRRGKTNDPGSTDPR